MNVIEQFFEEMKKKQHKIVYEETKEAWEKQPIKEKIKNKSKEFQEIAIHFFVLGYTTAKVEDLEHSIKKNIESRANK